MVNFIKFYKDRFGDRCFISDRSVPASDGRTISNVDHFSTAKRGKLHGKPLYHSSHNFPNLMPYGATQPIPIALSFSYFF
ncbi:MAG: hypothetical protein LBF94_02530 [Puniceicoccales bacterium]|nr:hypothetical protein [Puniceicoccales bacterium]